MVTIKDLQSRKEAINVSWLAGRIAISPNTLTNKIRKGSDLTTTESLAIEQAYAAIGIFFGEPVEIPQPIRKSG